MVTLRHRLSGLLLALGMLCAVIVPALAEPPIPALTGRVVDQAGILDSGTISTLTSQLAGYESSTGNQVVVVTLPDLKGYTIEDWGLALGRGWGIGQKAKNNGVILVVAPNDRQLRIEVGYGLEGLLPDATAYTIIQSEIIPNFKRGDMAGGVRAGVTAILAALGGSYKPQPIQESADGGFSEVLPALGMFGFIFVFVVISSLRRRYDPRRRRNVWVWVPPRSSSGGRSGGFSSGGGFSGGGGSFGGGGASGRW